MDHRGAGLDLGAGDVVVGPELPVAGERAGIENVTLTGRVCVKGPLADVPRTHGGLIGVGVARHARPTFHREGRRVEIGRVRHFHFRGRTVKA